MESLPHSITSEDCAEAGFTLVEIMVASAIAFVLALAVATLLANSHQQQTAAENRAARADFIQNATLDMRLKPVPSTTATP